jgi:hypothetical protein
MLEALIKKFFTTNELEVADTVYGAVIDTVPPVPAHTLPLKIVWLLIVLIEKGEVLPGCMSP